METRVPTATPDAQRPEVSASTIARMMGVATNADLRLLENKVDLLSSKLNNVLARLDKVVGQMNLVATGSDMDRFDARISSLQTMIAEKLGVAKPADADAETRSTAPRARSRILSSMRSEDSES